MFPRRKISISSTEIAKFIFGSEFLPLIMLFKQQNLCCCSWFGIFFSVSSWNLISSWPLEAVTFSNYTHRYTLDFILQKSKGGRISPNFLCVIKQCVPITNCLIHILNQSRPQATLWSQPNSSTVSSHLPFQCLFSSWRQVPSCSVQVLHKFKALFKKNFGPNQRHP